MHAVELADLASTLVRAAPAQYALRLSPGRQAPEDYWLAARYRHENWMHDLSLHRDAISRPGISRRTRQWQEILPILQEILLSEPLSRVVGYHAEVLDELGIDHDFAPLANSSLAAHVEARNRCLHLIVFGQGLPVESAVSLNRLRRTLECFTDNLLSCLPPVDYCGLYCFDPSQVADRQIEFTTPIGRSTWTTLQTLCSADELWHSIRHGVDWRSGSPRLNYQLSQHVLRLNSAQSFDSFGVPHSAAFSQFLHNSPESTAMGSQSHPLFAIAPLSAEISQRHRDTANPRRRHDF